MARIRGPIKYIACHVASEARAYARSLLLGDPFQDFCNHACRAKRRNIEFKMTFPEWWEIWKDHYHLRGRQAEELCMGRKSDAGAYEVGNVYITTNAKNVRDYAISSKAHNDIAAYKVRRRDEFKEWVHEQERRVLAFVGPRLPYERLMELRCLQK